MSTTAEDITTSATASPSLDIAPQISERPPASRLRLRLRWWGAAAGIVLAIVDTYSASRFGVTITMGGRDVTWGLCAYFAVSFATLGFLAGYVLDLRRRDRHQAALVQAQMAAINTVQARLAQSEKLAAIGQLAATVAHEVRNPLAVIRSATQDLAERLPAGEDDSAAVRSCSFITAEIDRLTSVISSLLAMARPLRVDRRPVAVAELLGKALLLARGAPNAKQVPVRHRHMPGLPPVEVDGDLVCQVLIDLLTNAAEATSAGGEVTLEARAHDGAVELMVGDSGPGVPPALRSRIFEPFFTTRAGGTGLGLAVARQIVEAHGGRIDVGDRPGGGALFTVRLPTAGPARVAA